MITDIEFTLRQTQRGTIFTVIDWK